MSAHRDREFTHLLERHSPNLASFVLALVGDRHVADDLFQSTCLELWRHRRSFEPGTNFGAWSRVVARHQIQRFWRRGRREKLAFGSQALDHIAAAYEPEPYTDERERTREALRTCLQDVSEQRRAILRRRYNDGSTLRAMARETGRTEASLKMMLMRLRRKLAECVQRRLSEEARADG